MSDQPEAVVLPVVSEQVRLRLPEGDRWIVKALAEITEMVDHSGAAEEEEDEEEPNWRGVSR